MEGLEEEVGSGKWQRVEERGARKVWMAEGGGVWTVLFCLVHGERRTVL